MAHTTFTVAGEITPAQQQGILDRIADLGLGAVVERVNPTFTYKIEQDTDPESPRKWDNVGVMHCAHNRYTLGDKDAPTPFVDDDWRAGVLRDDIFLALPLYLYDHSGLAFSHTPFSCKWDSGQLGWHYVTKQAAQENWPKLDPGSIELRDAVERCLQGELETYQQFIAGDVWGFIIEDEEGKQIDSCWGFYGDDEDDVIGAMLDHAGKEHEAGLRAAWDDRFD